MFLADLPNLPLYADLAYMNGNWKYYTMEPHCHGLLECNYIENGNCVYEIQGTSYELTQKNLILFDSSLPHRIRFNHERPCTVLGFSLSLGGPDTGIPFPGIRDVLNHSLPLCHLLQSLQQAVVFPDARAVKGDMLRLFHEFEGRQEPLFMSSLCYQLLCEITRLPLSEKSSVSYYVEKTDSYIRESFYLIQSNEQIASHIGLNPTYLERIFKRQTGSTLWEAVTTCRLAAAKELLAQPGIPIREIDNMIGFANRQTFYLQFKKHFGISPSEYRKSCLP